MTPPPVTAFTDAERAEIKELVFEALTEYFKDYGRGIKGFIIATAIVLGSIVGIVMSLKTIAGWLGIGVILSR